MMGGSPMEIINLDSNGNKIKDLSKVVLSQEKSLLLYQLIIRSNNNRGVTA
ncbi:hypothetical protein IGJ87_002179 [Enterococcus sp. DIV1411a]